MAAAVKAMTALGAMFAIAWAETSGADITPRRSPASVGAWVEDPAGGGGADMGSPLNGWKGGAGQAGGSGDQQGAQRFPGLEVGERLGGLGKRTVRGDQRV